MAIGGIWTSLRVTASRILGFFGLERGEREFDEEVAAHLAMLAEENVRRGMSPEDARAAALRSFGGVAQVRQVHREMRGLPRLESVLQDVRYGLRMMRRGPAFTAIATVTLGVGIGLNTTVFTVYDSIALRLLPVKDPGSVVRLKRWYESRRTSDRFTQADYRYVRDHAQSLSSVAAATVSVPMPAGQDAPVHARFVSGNYFPMLGVSAQIGRTFLPEEDADHDSHPVAVLSYRFWQRHFHGDASVLGTGLVLNGTGFTVVGVAPQSFAGTGAPPHAPDLWIPIAMRNHAMLPDNSVQILGRRKPGISPQRIETEMATIEKQLESIEPPREDRVTRLAADTATFFDHSAGDFDVFLWASGALMIAVSAVLLIGCVNLVNLLLARAMARESEIAVRCAMGAGRGRVIQQLCIESAMLGVAGGAAGLLFSIVACRFLMTLLGTLLARFGLREDALFVELTPGAHVYGFTLVISLATGLLAGLVPARQAVRGSLIGGLKSGAALARRGWMRNALIAAQITACLVLLMGAGLLGRGVIQSSRVDPGFETKHVFIVGFTGDVLGTTEAERAARLAEVARRFEAVPQVRSVSIVEHAPMMGHGTAPFHALESRVPLRSPESMSLYNRVSPGYFETLGVPLLRGRLFTQQEADADAPVVVINDKTAQRFWPGEDPIGKRFTTMKIRKMNGRTFTVIGVVKSVRGTNLSRVDPAYLYFPGSPTDGMALILRSELPEAELLPLLRKSALDLGHGLAMQMVFLNIDSVVMQLQRMMTEAPATVAVVLGALGLLLSVVGIYGVVAYLVTQRTREIGVRMALGATRADVLTMILRQGLKPVLWGVPIGLAGSGVLSLFLGKLVTGIENPDLLFGVSPWSPVVFVGVLAFLAVAVGLSSWWPARRAMRIDPAVALRYE